MFEHILGYVATLPCSIGFKSRVTSNVRFGQMDESALMTELMSAATGQPKRRALLIGINYERTEAQLQVNLDHV